MNRLLPGIALVVGWFLLLFKGGVPAFALILLLGLAIGGYEYAKMAFVDKSPGQSIFLAFLSTFPLLFQWAWPSMGLTAGLVFAFILLALLTLVTYRTEHDNYGFLVRGTLGLVWVGFLGAHLYLIRLLPEGNIWLLILTGITAGSDSGAYYVGKSFGKHKLSPLISPKKTVEGAVGGVVTGVVVASGIAVLFLDSVPWLLLLASAIVLTVVGICGDLTESVIKRATNTKDSGTILGGHGGILDRADSILFAAPLLYIFLQWGKI